MNELMKVIMDLGLHLVPLAFLLYLPIRWLEYVAGGFPYHGLLNGLWYATVVGCYVLGWVGVESMVTLLLFISMLDGFFIHLEKQRTRNNAFDPAPDPSGEGASEDEHDDSASGSSARG